LRVSVAVFHEKKSTLLFLFSIGYLSFALRPRGPHNRNTAAVWGDLLLSAKDFTVKLSFFLFS
jgi:hypothetical protein